MSHAKQTRRVTLASRDTLIQILETLPGALFVIDDIETIVYANANARAMARARPEACIGNSFWRCSPRLVSPALYQAVQKTKQRREPTEVEYRSPVAQTWLHVQLAPTVGGLALHFHEKRVPTGSQETFFPDEHLAADVPATMYVGIGWLTPEGNLLDINEAPLADVQIRREEVIGKPFAQAPWWSCSPASQQQLRTAIKRASRGETVRFETLVHPREGINLHLEVTITPHRDVDHHIEYLVYVGTDITTRKRAEAEIHTLVDAIPQFVWMIRPDGFSEYHNRRWCDYTKMAPEQAQGDGWIQCLHPDDQQRIRDAWQISLKTGTPFETEQRLRSGTTGEYRWFLARAMPARDGTGQIIKWFGTSTDIEDQKRIEEALRQSQERIRALIDSNIIGIVSIAGEEEVLVEANEAFLHMTGYTREEVCSGTLTRVKVTPPEQAPLFERARQEVITHGQHTPYETEVVCKDGSRLPVLVGGVLFQEQPRQMIDFVLDNSARKELEQRKDAFISMASHELRNPLTALKLQTTLLHRQLARQSILDKAPALASIETQIKTITRLVEELLDVSKIQAGRLEYVRELVDLGALLREIADTMQHTHPSHHILVRGAVQASLIGDRDRLEQVFTNLLSNAIKYSPGAETVEMDLDASEDAVTIRVQDHGLGIPSEQRDKIFERFYRATDPRQRAIPGLGMGLYIVAEIVKSHRGTINVESEVGKGSTFTVTFPKKREA